MNRLRALGKVQKTGKWVPHKLSENNMNQRQTLCISLRLKQKKRVFSLKQLLRMKNGSAMITTTFHAKTRNSRQKGDAMCLVGLEKNNILRAS